MFGSSSAARNNASFSDSSLHIVSRSNGDNHPNGKRWIIFLILLLGVIVAYHFQDDPKEVAPGIVMTPEGDLKFSPQRKAKLERELEEIDNAVQYALVVDEAGDFPCFSCPSGQITIFLKPGEIYKYGVTRKGKNGRYPGGNYGAPDLLFVPQFKGTYSECLKMEKTKIYNYPFLPQARNRIPLLHRPPGNRYDS